MKNTFIAFLLPSALLTISAATWAQTKPPAKPQIAVLTLDDRGGLAADATATLTDYFRE